MDNNGRRMSACQFLVNSARAVSGREYRSEVNRSLTVTRRSSSSLEFSKSARKTIKSQDVLRKVTEKSPLDLRWALEKLQIHSPASTKLYQSLLLASKGFETGKDFYIPRDDSGSPLTLMMSRDQENNGPTTSVAFFTSYDRVIELYDTFTGTNLLNFNEGIVFCGVPLPLCDTIEQVCRAKGGVFKCLSECSLMTLSPHLALQFDIKVPDHVYLAPLTKEHATVVQNNWHRISKRLEVTEREIVNLPSMGIYIRKTDELVSWLLQNSWGMMGMMSTKMAHRRSGYGELVANALAKRVAMIGLTPFVYINVSNKVSYDCFTKMGFQEIHPVKWLIYAPPHLSPTVDFFAATVQIPYDQRGNS